MPAKKNAPSGPHNGGSHSFWSGYSVSPAKRFAADNTRVGGSPGKEIESGFAKNSAESKTEFHAEGMYGLPLKATGSNDTARKLARDTDVDYSPVSDAENAEIDRKFGIKK